MKRKIERVQTGVRIGRCAQTDDADGDVRFAASGQQLLVVARLFGVGGVGEEDDVARLGLRLLKQLDRVRQGFVNTDPAAGRPDRTAVPTTAPRPSGPTRTRTSGYRR